MLDKIRDPAAWARALHLAKEISLTLLCSAGVLLVFCLCAAVVNISQGYCPFVRWNP